MKCKSCGKPHGRKEELKIKLVGHMAIGLTGRIIASRYLCEGCFISLHRTRVGEIFTNYPRKNDFETLFLFGKEDYFLGTVIRDVLPELFKDFGELTSVEGYAKELVRLYPKLSEFVEKKLGEKLPAATKTSLSVSA